MLGDVADGSHSVLGRCRLNVRITPKSNHVRDIPDRQFGARTGSRPASLDHLVGRGQETGGTVRASAFAVLRLTTSEYAVGACTGRSAGFRRAGCNRHKTAPVGGCRPPDACRSLRQSAAASIPAEPPLCAAASNSRPGTGSSHGAQLRLAAHCRMEAEIDSGLRHEGVDRKPTANVGRARIAAFCTGASWNCLVGGGVSKV
jgi:hypothetical protein